jgi:hypothetical protein
LSVHALTLLVGSVVFAAVAVALFGRRDLA